MSKLKTYFNFKSSSEKRLLEQRYLDLYTSYEKVKVFKKLDSPLSNLIVQIDDLFDSEKDWDKANNIEQLMVALYDEAYLDAEIKVKLLCARRKLKEDIFQFFRSEYEGAKDERSKQSLLTNLNKAVHWAYDIEDIGKRYIAKTRIRTCLLFIASILMFFMVDQLQFIAELLSITKGEKGDYIVTAMASGWMGTSLSMLISLKERINISVLSDLKTIYRFDYLISRVLIGMISGLIMFYAFQSGILTGIFFPVFGSPEQVPLLDEKNHALLIIWCFISGFSEKLVPDLLTKTGDRVKSGKTAKQV